MNKKLRYSLLTLLMAVFCGAWAGTETITLSEQGYSNAELVSSTEGTNFTITYNQGSAQTAPAYYNTGTGVRVYAGGNVVVSSEKTMTKVVFTYAKNNSPTVELGGSTVDSPATWEGSANSVQLDVKTKGHIRLQSVVVTYEDGSADPRLDPEIAFSVSTYEGVVDDMTEEVTFDNPYSLPVTFTSSNTSVAEYSDGDLYCYAAGTATITATFEGDDTYQPAEATLTVTVTDPNAPGSENNPYTVAQAVQAIDNSGNVTGVYVKGIVSQVDEVSTSHGNATYWISSDGTTEGQQFEVYRGKYLEGANFTSADQIQVGDEVLVKGNITYYESDQVYEFSAGSQIVSLKRKQPIAELNSITPTELLLTDGDGEFTLDATFAEGTVADTDYIVVWQSDNTSVIDVFNDSSKAYYELKGVGTANITITVMPNDETLYTEVSKTFEVTVVDHFKTDIATINGFDPTEVNIGDTGYMVADYSDIASPDDNFTLSWSSSDENVFYVNPETYDYEARAEGTAEVTFTITPENTDLYNEVSFTQTVTVIDNTKNMLRTYQLVTNTDDITDDKYLIVYEGNASGKDDTQVTKAFDGSRATLDGANNNVDVTVAGDLIVTNQDIYFTISTADDVRTLQSASGKYIGRSSNSNGMESSETTKYTNTFAIDEDGNAVITASGNCTLRYNYGADDQRFRYYKSGQQAIKLYKEIPTPETVEVTIGEAGAATFSSIYPLDFTDSDVYAYIITGRDGTNFTKERVYQVPANTGVVVAAFTADTYQVPVAATDATIENNLLEATSTGEYTVTADDYGTVYGLFKSAKTGKVGFQKKKEGYTFGANKSYLRMPAGTSANEIFFDFDVTNAISNVAVETEAANSTDTYNLNGQKVNSSFRGVVIRGGKKLIQK